jgi:pimeloyl-ACP methyl ester carboxylesterase
MLAMPPPVDFAPPRHVVAAYLSRMQTMRTMLALLVWLASTHALRAQDFIWSQWETTAVRQKGPEAADGLLVYFHGYGPAAADRLPIVPFFVEIARAANWDILRINRLPFVDIDTADADILSVAEARVAEARRKGYRRVVLGGHSRGGWLALSGASVANVDGVIGLAPASPLYRNDSPDRDAAILAARLSQARVPRIAAFFFEGDPAEDTSGGRALTIQRALEASGSSFLLVDRPPDLVGPRAVEYGRFTRRYRDCVVEFLRAAALPAGAVPCTPSRGHYALGAEIDFPAALPPVRHLEGADRALDSYVGRWQGDDQAGGYVIMQAIEVGSAHVLFQFGHSPPVGFGARGSIRELSFRKDDASDGLKYTDDGRRIAVTARLLPSGLIQLDLEAVGARPGQPSRRFMLRKQP